MVVYLVLSVEQVKLSWTVQVPLPVTVAVVAPAVPLKVTSPVVKSVTGSLKSTVKLMGEALVGSDWLEAWLMVTEGATLSKLTVLSVLVEAALALLLSS